MSETMARLPLFEPQDDGSLKRVPERQRATRMKDRAVKLVVDRILGRRLVLLTPGEEAERAEEAAAAARAAEARAEKAAARARAIDKLAALGLEPEEIAALMERT